MIQSILFFALGFFCAAFIALLIAPAVWRRAVVLTQRRIEASVPLSANEIRAETDRIRAEFAMATRRLEMGIESGREKAAAHLLELGRNREELARLKADHAVLKDEKARLETELGEARSELEARAQRLAKTAEQLADTRASLQEHVAELERLGRAYDDATYMASTRQIELVARESEIDKLSADLGEVRNQRKDAERKTREVAAETRAVRDELKHQRRKTQELEGKVEQLMSSLSDREETLERREREVERLRQQLAASAANVTELSAALAEAEQARTRLQAQAEGAGSDAALMPAGAPDLALAKIVAERDRLEVRLATLARENKRLAEQARAAGEMSGRDVDEERENALLRDQIATLAAQVVSLTATLDGDDSAIERALSSAPDSPTGTPSLADRVRALQRAAKAESTG